MADEGYDSRQIGLSLIKPHMGKRGSAKKSKLSAADKAKQKVRTDYQSRKALVKGKAQQAKAKAKAKVSGEDIAGPEDAGEEEKWKDSCNLR